jgi:uroporphyrinogen-III synthase
VVGSAERQAEVAARLAHGGAHVEAPEVCAPAVPKWRADRLRELLTTRPVHAVAFSDAAQVSRLLSALDPEERPRLARVTLAAADAETADALRLQALAPAVEVATADPDALTEALVGVLAAGTVPDDG